MKMFLTTFDEEKKLWYGRDVPLLYNPKISIAVTLLSAMKTFGSKVAQISDNSEIRMTYDEIRIQTIRAAQNLRARGYKPKQTFMLVARNHHFVAPITFASLAIACPLNCIDPAFGRMELSHMLKIVKPVVVFCEITCYELVNECLMELKSNADIFTFDGSQGRSEPIEHLFEVTHKEHEFVPIKVDGQNDTAIIICSRGRTGPMKGVCLSHSAILQGSLRIILSNTTEKMLCFSSLYRLSGIWTLMRGTLSGATRIITTDFFTPELYICLIGQYQVTYAMNTPHQIALILKNCQFAKAHLSSLKYQIIAGGKVPLPMKRKLHQHLVNTNISIRYGMSEVGGIIATDFPGTSNASDTVGQLADGIFVKIIDNHANRCGVSVDGEICVKVDFHFLGYYGDRIATDEMFDSEGFIKTGDVGHFDADGQLFVTGRIKELLKNNHFHVSPTEIEAFLNQSPDIQLACVIGIDDSMANDLPTALVVRERGSNITKNQIFDLIADHFADHCKLRGGIYFVGSLPMTPSGKLNRLIAKEMAISMFNVRSTSG